MPRPALRTFPPVRREAVLQQARGQDRPIITLLPFPGRHGAAKAAPHRAAKGLAAVRPVTIAIGSKATPWVGAIIPILAQALPESPIAEAALPQEVVRRHPPAADVRVAETPVAGAEADRAAEAAAVPAEAQAAVRVAGVAAVRVVEATAPAAALAVEAVAIAQAAVAEATAAAVAEATAAAVADALRAVAAVPGAVGPRGAKPARG